MKKKTWGIHTFMAIPAFLLFAVFFLYPLGRGLQMSLTNWDGIGKAEFIGLGNFRSFFTDKRAGRYPQYASVRAGKRPAAEYCGTGLCPFDERKIPRQIAGKNVYLYAGDNKPADHGLYLVSAAAAGKGLPVSSA